jgi:hypothetical protein
MHYSVLFSYAMSQVSTLESTLHEKQSLSITMANLSMRDTVFFGTVMSVVLEIATAVRKA